MANNNRFTRLERKELRRLAGMAYERELAKVLEALEKNFLQWRKGKINPFELSDLIHKFHNGIARDLWNFYETGHIELNVRHAVAEEIVSKAEISPCLLVKLNLESSYNEAKGELNER